MPTLTLSACAVLRSAEQVRRLPVLLFKPGFGGLKKKPSASELLDWLKLLLAEDIPPEALRTGDQQVSIPPLHDALLKNEQDVHLFERLIFMARHNR